MKKYYFFIFFSFFLTVTFSSFSDLKIKNSDHNLISSLTKKFKFLKDLESININNSFYLENNNNNNNNNNFSGFSFGLYNPIEYEISSYSLNFLLDKKIDNFLIIGCGPGSFSDISKVLFLENEKKASFTYNDLNKNLFKLFEERIKKKINNHIIKNIFYLNLKYEFNFISNNNLFNFYNSRNKYFKDRKNSINHFIFEDRKNSIKNYITDLATNLLKKNGILEISNNFIFYLNRKELSNKYCLLSKFEKNKIEKAFIIINIFNEFNKSYYPELEYHLSEKLNKENNFYELSLFPHDIFEENDISFINFLKENYSKIKIILPNTSGYIFEKEIILEKFNKNEDILKNLRENPLVLISKSFYDNFLKEDFYEFSKEKYQFGIIFYFEKK